MLKKKPNNWGGVIGSLIRCDKDIYRPSPSKMIQKKDDHDN